MKMELEGNLKEVLNAIEEYNKTAWEVIEYYKNKGYETNASCCKL
jgi:hypothetical protein